ncbi:MAG TPA: type II toxin-antitoxin system VapB family antitoxin [Acidothermales bacterium]|jgi:Arc/MetJ family transcription regulator
MKTTVDITESLLREAQQAARAQNTTLRALIEDGLRTVLARRQADDTFTLQDASVPGDGLQPEFRGASWERIRDASYGSAS